jgi:hypothetical protein
MPGAPMIPPKPSRPITPGGVCTARAGRAESGGLPGFTPNYAARLRVADRPIFPSGSAVPAQRESWGLRLFLGGKIEKIGPHKAGATQLIVDAQGDKPAANAPAVRGAGLSKPATRERFFRGRRVGPAVFWPSPALVITPCTVDPRYGADLPVRDWVACSGRT